jgi:hypothetical protein
VSPSVWAGARMLVGAGLFTGRIVAGRPRRGYHPR